jgi:hypothetical protein
MASNFVIIGLPASGKTTFLAALWHLVEAGEESSRLALDTYEGDLTYLNLISEAWRTFQKVPRTSQTGDVNVTIHLVNSKSGEKGAAFFPDLAGETFDTQVESRRCRPEFVDSVSKEDGILFFISADVKGDSISIAELNSLMPEDSAEEGTSVELKEEKRSRVEVGEWEPKTLPTQVRVVQILSDLLRPPFERRSRRLAVIISAWDLTEGSGLDPQSWLDRQMPLVSQFLQTNKDLYKHQIYGVSAQGVSLENKVAVNQAANLTSSRRIRVVGPNENGHDLTAPLVWLMSRE